MCWTPPRVQRGSLLLLLLPLENRLGYRSHSFPVSVVRPWPALLSAVVTAQRGPLLWAAQRGPLLGAAQRGPPSLPLGRHHSASRGDAARLPLQPRLLRQRPA